MHSSSIRSNLFNVMAASRALQNVVSTKADRQAQALIQLSCTSPSPCSEKDSLLITLTTLHRRLGRVYSIALVKARTQGLGRLGCQPIMRVGTPGVARDTCQRSWDSTLYGLPRVGQPYLQVGPLERDGPVVLTRKVCCPNCAGTYPELPQGCQPALLWYAGTYLVGWGK